MGGSRRLRTRPRRADADFGAAHRRAADVRKRVRRIELQSATDERPTPVHDLLLPSELPLLETPAGTPSLDPQMVAVDSPSPIDLLSFERSEAPEIDLESEMMAPIARTGDREAIVPDVPPPTSLESTIATDPLGIRVIATADVAPDDSAQDVIVEARDAEPPSDVTAEDEQPESTTDEVMAELEVEEPAAASAEVDDLTAVSEASIDAAFEQAGAELVPTVDAHAEAESAPESLAEEVAPTEAEADLLSEAPGFGDGDADAGTFVPSPRLSSLTLQPDAWVPEEAPEVLIDGEWHDERVSDAAHLDQPQRFDDLAAAMMWVPTDSQDATDGPRPTAPDEMPFALHTPRSHLSFGGVEDQLRRRLELVPENWALRRQLGEVLLDSGEREAGLYELDLAMVGYELSGDLHGAMEVADEIVRLIPLSVSHHQKRVEYAVRAGDRLRLVDAYMELGDALFRDGQADKAHAVYARVLELSPGHQRATFALGNLTPPPIAPRERIGRPDGLTYLTPEDAFAEWEAPAHVLDAFVSAKTGEQPATSNDDATEGPADSAEVPPTEEQDFAATWSSQAATSGIFAGAAPEARSPESPSEAGSEPTPARESVLDTDALRREVERRQQDAAAAPEPAGASDTPLLNRARSLTPVGSRDEDFVDLGEWLRTTEPERTTRMVVEDSRPSGDEQADFDEMLRRFKRGVAENVDDEDFASHYDLGVAYKEMGLVDEAIAQFQRALRGESHRIRSYEALGQCFVEKGQHAVASALLQRAVETSQVDDTQLVGVLYLLGYSMEAMGRRNDAMRYYQRVFAVDIEFRDVAQRVAAMEHQTT
ncbi:MAG: tetratricopeptide repeat protein [Gemmatimonadaceae bacterium]